MAEPITMQKLIDAGLDSDSLGVMVNGDENAEVSTRLGQTYPSAKKAIKKIFESGGLPAKPFKTKNLLMADTTLVDGYYAQVTDDADATSNGLYVKELGAWKKSAYDKVTVGGRYFSYISSSTQIKGHIDNYLTQGAVFVTSGAIVRNPLYGFPIPDTAGVLTVIHSNNVSIPSNGDISQSAGVVQQRWEGYTGSAHRWGWLPKSVANDKNDGTVLWYPWVGLTVAESDGILSSSKLVKIGKTNAIVDYDLTNTNIDNFHVAGEFFVSYGSAVRDPANNYPIKLGTGFLTVVLDPNAQISTTDGMPTGGYIVQKFVGQGGIAYRWGWLPLTTTHNTSATEILWFDWSGVYSSSLIDANQPTGASTGNLVKKATFIGSSSMYEISTYLAPLLERRGYTTKLLASGGDALADAGLMVGVDSVKIKFTSGVIKSNSASVITTNKRFVGAYSQYRGTVDGYDDKTRPHHIVELSNGVVGIFKAGLSFTAQNISSDMLVDANTEFDVFARSTYVYDNGVYIVNIGKNNISSSATSDEIVAHTKMIVDFLPKGSRVLVLGHFSNNNNDRTAVADPKVDDVNNKLKAIYGLRYFSLNDVLFGESVWSALSISKTSDDITSINNRVLPPSLGRNNSHMSREADEYIAGLIIAKLTTMQYI